MGGNVFGFSMIAASIFFTGFYVNLEINKGNYERKIRTQELKEYVDRIIDNFKSREKKWYDNPSSVCWLAYKMDSYVGWFRDPESDYVKREINACIETLRSNN